VTAPGSGRDHNQESDSPEDVATANDPFLIDLQISDGKILGASIPPPEEARVEYAAFKDDNWVTVPY